MKMQRLFASLSALLVVLCVVFLNCIAAQAQKKSKYVCDEADPASLCTAANTCGSVTASCTVDITKVRGSSSVKPGIPGAKSNQFFCVKAGTTVVWMSSSKNTGFMVSFGKDSPFTPDDPIMGGGSKQVTVKATTPGCYKYDAGAFVSGATYGMGAGSKPELVIVP
jgi:plastocyanin